MPIYRKTATYGHFGKGLFSWEMPDNESSFKEYVEKEGGPEEAPLDNTTPIDSTKEFHITHIYIYPKLFTNYHYFTNKKYSYDTIVWFHNWNENGRGMDAYFLKGKLIAVEMTP